MKIAQINTTYGSADSTGRNVRELHKYFENNGHESRVYVTCVNNETEKGEQGIVLFSNRIDEKGHALLSRITGLQGYFSHLTTQKLIENLRAYQPDVILLNVLHSNCLNFNLFYNYVAKEGIPIIFVLHDCFFFTGHCCHFIDVKCEKWKKECGNCPSMKKWNKSLFFDTSKKALQDKKEWYDKISNKGVIAVSHWLEKEAKKSILKSAKVTTIYNWVDQEIFRPDQREPEEIKELKGKKIVLAVASYWSEDKGLKEVKKIADRCPDTEIIMVGANVTEVDDIKNIHAVGIIRDAEKLAEYYASADVFVNPSKQETFGKTTAEALACGTPVVAYETTACLELVDETRGALAELDNIEDYIAKTQMVLKNGKEYYTEAALEFAHANFNGQINMSQYIQLIDSVIRGK